MLRREVEGLGKERLTVDELDRAKNGIIGGQLMELQRAESRALTMALMEVYGFGYDDLLRYIEKVIETERDERV